VASELTTMRILVVSPTFPYPPIKGIKIRLFNVLRQLARRHEIHLAVMTQPEDPDPCPAIEAICSTITRLPPPRKVWDPEHPTNRFQDAGRVLRKLLDRRPHLVYIHLTPQVEDAIARLPMTGVDAVFCFRAYLFPLVAAAAGNRPLVVDFDDVEHAKFAAQSRLIARRGEAWLTAWESRKHRAWEFAIARRAAAAFVCSEIDRRRFPISCQSRIHLLPNGADFEPDGGAGRPADEVPGRLLMVGDMGYMPNADGAVTFCERILPLVRERLPEVELCIVGNHPDREVLALAKLPGVRVTGFVPEIAPWFQSASVLVVPLRFGGGTRLKILEALQWRRAVVTTPAGCEGLDLEPGKHLVVASTDGEFADAVVELATHAALRRELGERGREWARQRYGWNRIGDGLLKVMEEVVQAAPAH
jgi:glycosyltransferase involved in cell wall biosynthesis